MDTEMIMAVGFLIWMVVLFTIQIKLSRRKKNSGGIGSVAGIITLFSLGE